MADWTGLRAMAEKQSTGYAKMVELNGGIGKLGVQHPDMFEDMMAWDEFSENDHADTVLNLLDALDAMERQRDALINKREQLIARIRSLASEAQQ